MVWIPNLNSSRPGKITIDASAGFSELAGGFAVMRKMESRLVIICLDTRRRIVFTSSSYSHFCSEEGGMAWNAELPSLDPVLDA